MSSIDEQMVVAHFIVSDDVERSCCFYTDVLGGKTVISGRSRCTAAALAGAHRVGAQRAKRLLFTGDSLSGAEALEPISVRPPAHA